MKDFEQNFNKIENNTKDIFPIENKKEKLPCIFKINISLEEYILLTKKFKFQEIPQRFYIYLDTSDLSKEAELFRNNIRLRIKIKESKYFLELKKRGNDKFEISDSISTEEYKKILSGILPDGNIRNKLIEIGILTNIKPIDMVESDHKKTDFHDGYLMLEKTIKNYNKEEDFQVEFRSERKFIEDEVSNFITKELGIVNISKDKTKLQKFWENR